MLCLVLSHSVVSNSLWPCGPQPSRFLCPWAFSRQEYWSGLSFPFPGALPDPGIEPVSPALAGGCFTPGPLGKSLVYISLPLSFPGGSESKASACKVEDLGSIPETWVRSLSQEDPLEKEVAIHSSTLAWKTPWMEKPGAGYSPWGHKESDMTERLHFHFLL